MSLAKMGMLKCVELLVDKIRNQCIRDSVVVTLMSTKWGRLSWNVVIMLWREVNNWRQWE